MKISYDALLGLGVFYLSILIVGIWAAKKKEGSLATENMFLAGRNMPLWLGVFTLTATWVGGGYINGTTEAVYANGLLWCQAPWGYSLSLCVGGLFFAAKMRDKNYRTMLDPFDEKFGKDVSGILFIPAVIGDIFWSAAILAALGTTFSTILGLDYQTSIIISAAFAIAYTLPGGLWSVAYTDAFQLLLIIFGFAVATPFILDHVTSFSDLWHNYKVKFGDAALMVPPIKAWTGSGAFADKIWYWSDMALLLICGGVPWGVYFQRVLSCKNGKAARNLSIIAGVICFLFAIPAVVFGAIAATTDWSLTSVGTAPEGPMALPYVLNYLTPRLTAVIGMGAVAAAVMSSVDSSILSVASMFVTNIYCRTIRPQANNKEIMKVTRLSILLVGLIATALALQIKSVYALWYFCADLVYVVLFPQLVMVLYYKSANRLGSIWGIIVAVILRFGGGEPLLGLPGFINYPMQDPELGSLFPFRTTSMLASMLTIYAVSWVTKRFSQQVPAQINDLENIPT